MGRGRDARGARRAAAARVARLRPRGLAFVAGAERRRAGPQAPTYRALFSGPVVERIDALQFQRPHAEAELSADDAERLGVATGDPVTVGSNGTSRELQARVNRRLRAGVVRIAEEHAAGLDGHVEVTKA